MDFEVVFGRPRGCLGAPFSERARPEAARPGRARTVLITSPRAFPCAAHRSRHGIVRAPQVPGSMVVLKIYLPDRENASFMIYYLSVMADPDAD